MDIDISAMPFTNTPPIRRLKLCPGESSEIPVAYIDAPTLQVAAVRQRYTCLTQAAEGSQYRLEVLPWKDLPDGFVAELSMGADGLVEDYPPLFHRVPLVKG